MVGKKRKEGKKEKKVRVHVWRRKKRREKKKKRKEGNIRGKKIKNNKLKLRNAITIFSQ